MNKIEVYTNGHCNLCRWTRARVESRPREEMADAMPAHIADGRWAKGYFAWIELIRALPCWKWLAPILSLWPFTKMGPIFYHWLAARRYTLFGVPRHAMPAARASCITDDHSLIIG